LSALTRSTDFASASFASTSDLISGESSAPRRFNAPKLLINSCALI
jgi:hypothetical protein